MSFSKKKMRKKDYLFSQTIFLNVQNYSTVVGKNNKIWYTDIFPSRIVHNNTIDNEYVIRLEICGNHLSSERGTYNSRFNKMEKLTRKYNAR